MIGFITVAGHLLWMFFAFLWRWLSGRLDIQLDWPETQCLRCGQRLLSRNIACAHCRLHPMGEAATEICDLLAMQRQLQRFLAGGQTIPQESQALAVQVTSRLAALRKVAPGAAVAPRRTDASVDAAEAQLPEVLPAFPIPTEPVRSNTLLPEPAPVGAAPSSVHVFASFMEERNVVWGELVGGLLMVGCSLALVISLWRRLETIPYFPFFIFASITTAIFGMGFYAYHRLQVPSTGRALLAIASLLTPLNFVVMAGLVGSGTEVSTAVSAFRIFSEAAALLLFGISLFYSGRILISESGRILLPAVLGTAVVQLLYPRFLASMSASWVAFLGLAICPSIFQCASSALYLRATRSKRTNDPDWVNTLATAGLTSFPVLVTLTFMILRGGLPFSESRFGIAPGLTLIGCSWLSLSLPLKRSTPKSGLLSTGDLVGTGMLLACLGLLALAVVCAWPQPGVFVAVCGLTGVVLTWVAFRENLPLLHGLGLPGLVAAVLTGVALVQGRLEIIGIPSSREFAAGLFTSQAAFVLAALAAVLAGLTRWLHRAGLDGHVRPFALAELGCAALAVAAFHLHTILPAGQGVVLLGFLAALASVEAAHHRRVWLAWAASGLFLGCQLHFFTGHPWTPTFRHGFTFALFVHAACVSLATALVRVQFETTVNPSPLEIDSGKRSFPAILNVFGWSALLSATAGVLAVNVWWENAERLALAGEPGVVLASIADEFWLTALCIAWFTLVILVVAWDWRNPHLFGAGMVAGYATALAYSYAWLYQGGHPWTSLGALEIYAIALALAGLAWSMLRLSTRTSARLDALFRPKFFPSDLVVLIGLLGVQWFLHALLTTPTILAEFKGLADPYIWTTFSPYLPWYLLGTLGTALACVYLTGYREVGIRGILVVLLTVPWVIGWQFRSEQTITFTLLWALASCHLFVGVGFGLLRRPFPRASGSSSVMEANSLEIRTADILIWFGTAAPFLLLMIGLINVAMSHEDLQDTLLQIQRGSFIGVVAWTTPIGLFVLGLGTLAYLRKSAGWLYATALGVNLLVTLATALCYFEPGPLARPWLFVRVNVLVGNLLGMAWFLARDWRREVKPQALNLVEVLHLNIWPLALAVGAIIQLFVHWKEPQVHPQDFLTWLCLGSNFLIYGIAWQLSRVRSATLGLYLSGFLGVFLIISRTTVEFETFAWVLTPAAGGYLAISAVLVTLAFRDRSAWIPDWFIHAELVLGTLVALASVRIVLWYDTPGERWVGPLAAGLVGITFWLLCHIELILGRIRLSDVSEGIGSPWSNAALTLRHATVGVAVLVLWEACCVPLAASPIEPLWLWRFALAVLVCGACAFYFSGAHTLRKPDSDWQLAGDNIAFCFGAVSVLLMLWLEAQWFEPVARRAPMPIPAILASVIGLILFVVSSIAIALDRGTHGLPLTNKIGRTAYVYLAEVLLFLVLAHLRMTVPELFSGWVVRYWTFIILGLAYAGAGLSEYCERRGLRVVADPVQWTSLALPLLPLISYWVHLAPEDTHVRGLGSLANELRPPALGLIRYAFLWFLAAGIYGLHAFKRGSIVAALAAVLALNFGLWSLLVHGEIGFLLHPQAWLVPLAILLLAVEYVHHDRLSPEQRQVAQYGSLLMLYVSSTADMFITGLGNSVWLPLVLASLSVGGILLGMLLRLRSFLFLGTTFLFVVVVSMIWHAAREQVWVWWSSGIVLGASILALFAVFEKRRQKVGELLDQLRQWE